MNGILAIVALTAFGIPAGFSQTVMSVGGNSASACFRAAEVKDSSVTARAECDRALAVEPLPIADRAATLVNRSILLFLSGNRDRAAEDLAEAGRLDPNQPEVYLNQAVMALNEKRDTEARALADKAMQLGTAKPALAYLVRGLASEGLGQVKSAYSDLKQAAALAPGWNEPVQELARYRVR